MTAIADLLSRALLVRDRTVPRDIVPLSRADHTPAGAPAGRQHRYTEAAENLRSLCETLVVHTPASALADFVTEQVPQPRSALVLACLLQLTETGDGARAWWEYAAGAGQAVAAYCLYLHHLSLGEEEVAAWWHGQSADDDYTLPTEPQAQEEEVPEVEWHPGVRQATSSTATILRVLRNLARTPGRRPHSWAVSQLMAYVPTAVAVGYLRQPDIALPVPGRDFAAQITARLNTQHCTMWEDTRSTDPAGEHTGPQPAGPHGTAGGLPFLRGELGQTARH
ncbi:hypothetical protein [Streptomyces sp. NPDC046925]|uniref:hypothetical protein n=1 Tax=Streptomyces sp. NPDC046925 TaxID=3155375 RepID=UPI0033EEDAF3